MRVRESLPGTGRASKAGGPGTYRTMLGFRRGGTCVPTVSHRQTLLPMQRTSPGPLWCTGQGPCRRVSPATWGRRETDRELDRTTRVTGRSRVPPGTRRPRSSTTDPDGRRHFNRPRLTLSHGTRGQTCQGSRRGQAGKKRAARRTRAWSGPSSHQGRGTPGDAERDRTSQVPCGGQARASRKEWTPPRRQTSQVARGTSVTGRARGPIRFLRERPEPRGVRASRRTGRADARRA